MSKSPSVDLRRSIYSLMFIGAGAFGGAAFQFLGNIILARTLGPVLFGVLASALALCAILTPVMTFGLSGAWMQLNGAQGCLEPRWMAPSRKWLIGSTALVIALLGSAAFGALGDESSQLMGPLIGHVVGLAACELLITWLQLQQSTVGVALAQSVPHMVRLLIVVLFAHRGEMLIAVIYAAFGILVAAYTWFTVLTIDKTSSNVSQGAFGGDLYSLATRAWPFGLAGVFHVLYFQTNIVLTNELAGAEEAGKYSAAFQLVAALYLVPTIIYQRFLLKRLHEWRLRDRELFRTAFVWGSIIMFAGGLVSALAIYMFRDLLVDKIFGEKYASAGSLVEIFAVGLPFLFLAHAAGGVLLSIKLSRLKTAIMGAVALFNVAACFYLVPDLGAAGAAVTFTMSNSILSIIYVVVALREVRRPESK